MRMKNKEGGGDRLSDAMGLICDDFIEESEFYSAGPLPAKRNGKRTAVVLATAAALTIAVLLSVFIIMNTVGRRTGFPENGKGGNYETLPEELNGAVIIAEKATGRLISNKTTFLLTCQGDPTPELIASYLTISPSTDYSISKTNSGAYRITPASGSLDEGTVYRLTLGDPENPAVSFAFQTDSELLVKSFFPADYSVGVPIDTAIVVEFTEAVTDKAFNKIKITPKTEGKFELIDGGHSVVFLPSELLPFNTAFTVTVNSGIKSETGKTLRSGTTAHFQTESLNLSPVAGSTVSSSNSFSAWTSTSVNIGIGRPVELPVSIYAPENWHVSASLFRFPSASAAYDAALDLISSPGQTSLPESFYDKRLVLCATREEWGFDKSTLQLSFGDSFAEGSYLALTDVTIQTGGMGQTFSLYSFINVTGIASYVISENGETLVWTVNTVDGSPAGYTSVKGACFDSTSFASGWSWDTGSAKKISGKADGDGILRFKNDHSAALLLISGTSGDELVFVRCAGENDRPQYFSYVYTDRQSYRTKDTVRLWGYVSYTDGSFPEEVYLRFTGLRGRRAVTVSENGTFQTSFELDSPIRGIRTALITDADGNIICGRHFEYSDDPYPEYSVDIEYDKKVFLPLERISGRVSVKLFDGTPVGGVVVDVGTLSGNDLTVIETVITDDSGSAGFSFDPNIKNDNLRLGYVVLQYTARVTGADLGKSTKKGTVFYLPSAYILQSLSLDGRQVLRLDRRDFEASIAVLESGVPFDIQQFQALSSGPVSGKTASYTLERSWTETVTKQYYDSYTGKTETRTETSRKNEVMRSGKLPVENGIIDYTDLYPDEFLTGSSYSLSIRFPDDSNGQSLLWSNNLYARDLLPPKQSSPSYNPSLDRDREVYDIGSAFSIGMTLSGEPVRGLVGWYTGSLGDAVFCNGSARFDFSPSMKKETCLVYGVYYNTDQRQFYSSSIYIAFDHTKNCSLSPEISTDRTEYRPGEQAVISVHIDGGAGATVLVSVTDEACFAIKNQIEKPLEALIDSMWSKRVDPLFNRILTIRPSAPSPGGSSTEEAVGSSGIPYLDSGSSETSFYIRNHFADNAAFSELTLDGEGNGTLVMTVPDNITNWRITALAVILPEGEDDTLMTGSAVSGIISTQELIVSLGVFPEYLERDNVSVNVNALGTAAASEVRFSGEVRDGNGKTVATAEASADGHGYTYLDFGKLEAGEYTVTAYAVCGNARDAVEKKLRVIEYVAVYHVVKFVSPDEIAGLDPDSYPLQLSFINRTESGQLFDSILDLLGNSGVARSDTSAAAYVAALISNRVYGTGEPKFKPEITFRRPANSDWNKTIGSGNTNAEECYPSVFPYSEASIELFAKLLAACPADIIDSNRITTVVPQLYARVGSTVQRSPDELCSALVCLAALGEPVLDRLDKLAAAVKDLPEDAQLLLALAYAVSGDNPSANVLLSGVMKNDGMTDKETGTAYVGSDEGLRGRLTELALLVASRSDRELAAMLAGYLIQDKDRNLFRLGLASYIRFYLPCEVTPPATVVYSIGNRVRTVSLRAGQMSFEILSRSEHESFRVISIDGDVAIRAEYSGNISELPVSKQGGGMLVEKSISSYVYNKCRNITVTISVTVQKSQCWEVFYFDDFLPSGTAFISFANPRKNIRLSVSGRHISGYFYCYGGSDITGQETFTFSYVIRRVVDGEFTTDPPSVVRVSDGTCVLGPEYSFKFNGTNFSTKIK
jgi:hypothetical protein